MASTHLTRTSGTSTNTDIFTISTWVKRNELDDNDFFVYATGGNSDDNWFQVGFANDNKFIISAYNTVWLKTNRVFRDVNAWYHIVIKADSPQGTASNRLKLYVNGVEETSFTTDNRSSISQSQTWGWNKNSIVHYIGSKAGSNYFDGCLSHFHFSDGYAYDASTFGSTDSTTGEWKINTSPSFTLGTNGFTILKDGNTITDQSTNSNDFTLVAGTLTKTEDCPSNVFATLNVLERLGSNITISNGNTQFFNQASDWRTIISNLAFPNTGKFYAEMQVNEVSSAVQVGIMAQSSFVGHYQADLGTQGAYNSYAYMNTGQKRTNNSASNYGNSFGSGIIGIAVDMDNKNMYFSKDGVWQNSGNPESGSTGTGAPFTDLQIDKDYCFAVASQGSNPKVSWNFGNGYFGTTAVSSAGTNASGNGIFEYDVPTGYTALSTKGLNL